MPRHVVCVVLNRWTVVYYLSAVSNFLRPRHTTMSADKITSKWRPTLSVDNFGPLAPPPRTPLQLSAFQTLGFAPSARASPLRPLGPLGLACPAP